MMLMLLVTRRSSGNNNLLSHLPSLFHYSSLATAISIAGSHRLAQLLNPNSPSHAFFLLTSSGLAMLPSMTFRC